ncbi:MAG TPA: methionyl-tRNA formyltransferase [Candidatus Sulfotelmatobacter sp.]|nr:methionyl-tRNA formyltransferase [Candidatus Sulfotelmatobacter sp.]
MTKKSETAVFFGSGPVSAQALRKMAKYLDIEAVITKPQPVHHLYEMPVLKAAKELGLKTFTASNKAELSKLFESKQFKSSLGIVLDYGIIIPKAVIDYFPLGIINSHFSLLPKLRGADPISFAILSGDKQTGVSLMLINEKMDEGPLLAQERLDLDQEITTPELTDKLIDLSDNMLKQTVPGYSSGKIKPYAQTGEPTYTRKLTKEDSILDFSKTSDELCREVRAFAEWPRSRFTLNDLHIIVTKAHSIAGVGTPGKIYKSNSEFGLYTSDGIFIIDKLIPGSKKEMSSEAFLAGYKVA